MGLYDPGDSLEPTPGVPDPTEQIRRELIPQMPAEIAEAVKRGEPVWTTDEMERDFDPLGFAAPFMVVRQKADNIRGTLQFTGTPRYYFAWRPESPAKVQPNPARTPAPTPQMRPALFPLGQIVATPGAIETMNRKGIDPATLLYRHASGDWGDLEDEDKHLNDLAVQQGDRILSAYGVRGDPDRLWIVTGIVTEWSTSVTTILRPDEYEAQSGVSRENWQTGDRAL